MDKQFHDEHSGASCPDEIFSGDTRKIKKCIASAMDRYNRSVTTEEVQALFFLDNPNLSTAQKQVFESLFLAIKKEQPMGKDIAREVLSNLFRKHVAKQIANIGVDMHNGDRQSLEKLRLMMEHYGDDFIPNMNVEWEDIELETRPIVTGKHAYGTS